MANRQAETDRIERAESLGREALLEVIAHNASPKADDFRRVGASSGLTQEQVYWQLGSLVNAGEVKYASAGLVLRDDAI